MRSHVANELAADTANDRFVALDAGLFPKLIIVMAISASAHEKREKRRPCRVEASLLEGNPTLGSVENRTDLVAQPVERASISALQRRSQHEKKNS